jgi:hypothetical protein
MPNLKKSPVCGLQYASFTDMQKTNRVFFSGSPIYTCRDMNCNVPLTSESHLISRNFKGTYGPAILFDKVWNVILGQKIKREMLTGEHIIKQGQFKSKYNTNVQKLSLALRGWVSLI